MRSLYVLLAVTSAVVLAAPAAAVDLARMDRSIGKEPIYESGEPQYCLMVFGLEAKVRVWVVLDGDSLYLDRDGDGDLTDPGERVAPVTALHRSEKRPDAEVLRDFTLRRPLTDTGQVDGEPILSCVPDVFWFHVFQLVPRDDFDEPHAKQFRKTPFRVAVAAVNRYEQDSNLAFAARPEEAPILHFDGPRHFALSSRMDPKALRRGERVYLVARLTTPGLNASVTTLHVSGAGVPDSLHPVAEIECPPRRAGGKPVRYRVKLTQRC